MLEFILFGNTFYINASLPYISLTCLYLLKVGFINSKYKVVLRGLLIYLKSRFITSLLTCVKDIVLHWQPTAPLNSSNLKTIVSKNIKHWLNQERCTISSTFKINLLIMTQVFTTSIMLLIGRRIPFCNLVLEDEPKKQLQWYTAGCVFTKSERKPI